MKVLNAKTARKVREKSKSQVQNQSEKSFKITREKKQQKLIITVLNTTGND